MQISLSSWQRSFTELQNQGIQKLSRNYHHTQKNINIWPPRLHKTLVYSIEHCPIPSWTTYTSCFHMQTGKQITTEVIYIYKT